MTDGSKPLEAETTLAIVDLQERPAEVTKALDSHRRVLLTDADGKVRMVLAKQHEKLEL